MKGLEVYQSIDYSTGPGPRLIISIDCDEFPGLFDHYEEFDCAVSNQFYILSKLNSTSVSIILKNNFIEDNRTTVDLSEIIYHLEKEYLVSDVWIYTEYEFVRLLNTHNFHWYLWGSHANKYFVCGKYQFEYSTLNIDGEHCTFPVKPLYRSSFNQRIWKIGLRSQRDVTATIDPLYDVWFKQF